MKIVVKIVLTLVVAMLFAYIGMPVIAYGFEGLPVMLLVIVIVWKLVDVFYLKDLKDLKFHTVISILIVLCVLYIVVFPLVTSSKLLFNERYRSLIGQVDAGENFSAHIAPISIEKIRVVDQSLAELLGDKVLGAQAALGSQVTLGSFTIQKVKDQLYWVAPLLHSGFFKWQKNRQGTNGYVMVSATNERDVKLVQEVEGHGIRIKYQPEAFFGSYLARHIYLGGYATKPTTDYTFEIDDQGNPYWVVTTYKKTIGFSGNDATGVIVVDAESGTMKWYSIADAPAWIDRIQPAEFVETQLMDWGEYVKGYWNFSNEEKLKITEKMLLVYGQNNESYWYTGLTSVGADEATVGFVLINTRTKKAVWYKQGGATENAAQRSAMGKVQEKGYFATSPTPYNINGIPTYVMALKDNAGLNKMFALVSIQDYTIVGTGNTMQEALTAYKNAFNQTGNKINPGEKSTKSKISDVVYRITNDVKNGNSYYYISLAGKKGKIFVGTSQISNKLPLTAPGDSVEIIFDEDVQEVLDISTFDNFNLRKK